MQWGTMTMGPWLKISWHPEMVEPQTSDAADDEDDDEDECMDDEGQSDPTLVKICLGVAVPLVLHVSCCCATLTFLYL